MTSKELLNELTMIVGPCFRLCSYCPEDFKTAEVKECVEEMIRTNYRLRMDIEALKEELQRVKDKYKEVTGCEYQDT